MNRLARPLYVSLVLLVLAAPAAAQAIATDLGTMGGALTSPTAANAAGSVTGYAYTAGGAQHAFVYTASLGVVDLGTLPGGTWSEGLFITDTGMVVGVGDTATSPRHAWVWTADGGMVDLGSLGGDFSTPYDVNDAGQVVGVTYDASLSERAFIWTAASGMQDLGTLGGGYSSAVAINQAGQVAGTSQTAAFEDHAFLWTAADGMQDLGTLGGSFSTATHLSETGHVAGLSYLADGMTQHAFLWTAADGMVGVGDFGGGYSHPTGVTSSGMVIGFSLTSNFVSRAFAWTAADGLVDLHHYGDTTTSTATLVNDSGLVIVETSTFDGPLLHAWSRSGGFVEIHSALTAPTPMALSPAGVLAGWGYSSPAGTTLDGFAWSPHGGFVVLPTIGGDLTVALAMGGETIFGIGNIEPSSGTFHLVRFTLQTYDVEPPVVTVKAPRPIWPANGKMIDVTFTGSVTDLGSGVAEAWYAVVDEYGQIQPSGPLTVAADGSFSVTVRLEARRNGHDRDGRRYTLLVIAADEAGNTASSSAVTVVAHDQRGKK